MAAGASVAEGPAVDAAPSPSLLPHAAEPSTIVVISAHERRIRMGPNMKKSSVLSEDKRRFERSGLRCDPALASRVVVIAPEPGDRTCRAPLGGPREERFTVAGQCRS